MANLSSEERRKRYSTIARKEDIEQSEARKDINLNTKADERRNRYASKDYLEKYNAYHAPTRYDGSAVNRYLNAYGLNQQRQADRMQEYRNRYAQQQFMNAHRDAIRNGIDNGNNPLGLKNLENPLDNMRRMEKLKKVYGNTHKLSFNDAQKMEKAYGGADRGQLEKLKEHYETAKDRDYSGELEWVNDKLLSTATGEQNERRQAVLNKKIKDTDNRLARLYDIYAKKNLENQINNDDIFNDPTIKNNPLQSEEYQAKKEALENEKKAYQNELDAYEQNIDYRTSNDFEKYKEKGKKDTNNQVEFYRNNSDENIDAFWNNYDNTLSKTDNRTGITYTGTPIYERSDLDFVRAITEEEADNYAYILGKYGEEKAHDYLQSIAKHTDVNGAITNMQKAAEQGKKNPVLATIESAGLGLVTPFEAAKNITGFGGQYRTYDDYALAGRQEALRSGVNEAIQNTNLPGSENVLPFLYNTANSTADNLLRYAVGGAAGKAAGSAGAAKGAMRLMMAGQVGDSAMKSALDRGLTDSQAVTTAIISAINEELFETISLERLDAMKAASPKQFRDIAKNVGKQILAEGSEEVFTDIGNAIADDLVNGEKSEIAQNIRNYMSQGLSEEEAKKKASVDFALQLVESGLAGGLSGATMGGVETVRQINTLNNQNMYDDIAQSYINAGMSEEDAYDAADNDVRAGLENKYDNEGNLVEQTGLKKSLRNAVKSAAELNENIQNLETQMKAGVEPTTPISDADIRDTKENIRLSKADNEYLNEVGKLLDYDLSTEEGALKFIEAQDKLVEKYPERRQQITKTTSSVATQGQDKATALNDLRNELTNTMPINETSLESQINASQGNTANRQNIEVPQKAEFKATIDGEEKTIKAVNNGKIIVQDNNGREQAVNIREADLTDGASAAVEQAKRYGARGSRLYLDNLKSGNIRNYTLAFNTFYNAGKNGKTFYGNKTLGVDTSLLIEAYAAGVADNSKKSEVGGLIRNEARYKIKEAETRVLDTMGKKFGVTIQIDNMLSNDANGLYQDGIIHISANAENPALVVFSHEFTHRLEETSPEAYKEYENFVIDYLKEQGLYDSRAESLKNLYARAGVKLSEKDIRSEIAANATESFLTDADLIESVVNENKSLAQKIIDTIKSMIDDLKDALSGYRNPKSTEAQAIRNGIGTFEKALELWINAAENQTETDNSQQQFSLKEESNKQLEADYNAAVKAGNEEEAKKIVEQYANNQGYTEKVYHGTNNFGFTKLDTNMSDDKLSFFATNDPNIASTYSGLSGIRNISDDNILDFLKENKRWKNVKLLMNYDKSARYKYIREKYIELFDFVKKHKDDLIERDLYNSWTKANNDLTNGILYHELDINKAKELLKPLTEAHYVISDYAWKLYFALDVLEKNNLEKNVYLLDDRLYSEDDLKNGNYELLANTDNLLEIDGNGANWNAITYKNKKMSTREIAKIAKENGYSGVVIKNITDDGGMNDYTDTIQGDIYNFFNPQEQLKSADAVTYDDDGNVIPLSERFNKSNDDIRYSMKEDSEGRQLSPQQQEYFKNSKVVDENGNLRVVYHGTGADFTIFDISKARDTEDIEAFFFSGDKEEAEGYGDIKEFYLNIINPADYDTAYDEFFKQKKIKNEGAGTRTREELIKQGYDGIIAYDEDAPDYTEYIAFSPEQIKLVNNKKPTDNPDIRFSMKEEYGKGGYNGKSMSNRATKAYEYDEKPLSKWTKSVLLDEIDDILFNNDSGVTVDDFKKLTVKELKDNFLDYSSWHHTGALYNTTDFYKLNEDRILDTTKDDINKIIDNRKNRKAEEEDLKRRKEEQDKIINDYYKSRIPTVEHNSIELPKHEYLRQKGFELTPFTTKSGKKAYKYIENGVEKTVMDSAMYHVNLNDEPDIKYSLKEESNINRNDVAALTGNNEYMAEAVNDLEETLNNRYGDLLFDVKNYELYDVFDEICKQYNIKGYSKQKFARNVKELFDYIKNVDHPDGVDTTMLAMQVAADMLDKGSVLDTTMLEMYPTLPEELRNKKIKISQQDRADLDGGYARFRRKYFGNLTLTDEGTEVDTVYEGLSAQYPELFPSDITHPADRLTQIGNVVDLFKRTLDHIQGASKEESAFIIAQDIINKAVLERTKHEDSIAKKKRIDIQAKVREQVANLKKAEKEIYYENIRLRRRIKSLESLNNNANNKIAKQEKEWEDYKSGKKQVKGQEKFYRKQYYEKLKEEFVLGEVTRSKAKNRAERQATIDMIKNLTNKLSRTVLRPSENNYVPTYLLNSMIDVLQMIDLDSGYRNPDGSPTKVYLHLQNLKKQYEALRTDAKYNASGEDEQIKQVLEVIDRIAETVKDKRVNQLTNYELENLLALMKIIHYQINRSQELFKNQNYKRVADLSEKARENIKKAGREFDPNAKVKNIANKYLNNTLSPVRLFKRLEGYAKDGALTTIAEELQNGERESKLIKQTANDILKDLYETKEARKLLEEFRTKKLVYKFGEKEVVITPEMRVALYLHSLNEDNYRHIVGREKEDTQGNISYEGGGVVIPNYHKQKKSTSDTLKIHQAEKYTGQDVIKLTPQNVETIIKDMDEYDRMIVSKYKELNSYITDKLNDTTEELYGYKKATVKNYFPIIVDKSMLELDSDVLKLDKTIENMGSLKSRVNSVQPIYLEGVMDAIERQIDQAALFSGMAIPVRDFKKVWGLKTNETTLNREAQKAMGSYIDRYQKNLQGDLGRGREKGDSFALLGAGARGKMAMGALTGNLSVVMKQAASYPTAAGGLLGYQDLFAGLLYQGQRGKDLEEIIKKYTPLYADRDTAGIVGVNINDMSAFKKKNPKLYYGLTGWIESVDKATVRRLWYASENYVKRNFKYEVGSDKFYKEVAKVWEDTVRRTQPIYDTMNRPEYLRQNSDLAKFLLMFKTQSFQNIGILVDAVGEYKARSKDYKNNQTEANKKDKESAFKQLVKATSSQIIQMAVFTAITAIADAMLHRPKKWADEETGLITPESFFETYFENYLGNMLGQLAFGDVIKDAVYIAAGKKYTRYDLTVAPLDAINDVITGLYNARQAVNTREYDKAWKNIIKASETASQYGLGVPVKNIENLYKGVTGNVADIAAGKNPLETTTTQQMYNRIYLAYQSGNPEIAAELSKNVEPDKIKTKMVSKLKEEDTIKEAADYRYKSELDKYQAIVDAYVSLGFDEDWVTSAISSVMNKTYDTTGSGEYNSNDLQRAIDISAVQGSKVANEIYKEKYDTYKSEGMKDDEAKKKALSSVRSAITGKYKSQYESGTISQKVKIRDRLCSLRVAGERLYTYDSMKSWNK